ncbi:uncharacterized protein J3R85_008372 [Psidium guajava]|nr:uncharacterized protein J3R85_008372 [Psidium guajava]
MDGVTVAATFAAIQRGIFVVRRISSNGEEASGIPKLLSGQFDNRHLCGLDPFSAQINWECHGRPPV